MQSEDNKIIESNSEPLDLLWGGDEISAFVGLPIRKLYYLIDRKAIPVHKVGHRTIVASRAELRRTWNEWRCVEPQPSDAE